MPQGGNVAVVGRCHKGRHQWQSGGGGICILKGNIAKEMSYCKIPTLLGRILEVIAGGSIKAMRTRMIRDLDGSKHPRRRERSGIATSIGIVEMVGYDEEACHLVLAPQGRIYGGDTDLQYCSRPKARGLVFGTGQFGLGWQVVG